jgi:hypothetical protein
LVSSIKSDIARGVEGLNLSPEGATAGLKLSGFDRLGPEAQRQVAFDHFSTAAVLGSRR